MASYIMLANYTSLGIRNISATTQRARDFKKETEKVGIKVKDIYWTLGTNDILETFGAVISPSIVLSITKFESAIDGTDGNPK